MRCIFSFDLLGIALASVHGSVVGKDSLCVSLSRRDSNIIVIKAIGEPTCWTTSRLLKLLGNFDRGLFRNFKPSWVFYAKSILHWNLCILDQDTIVVKWVIALTYSQSLGAYTSKAEHIGRDVAELYTGTVLRG